MYDHPRSCSKQSVQMCKSRQTLPNCWWPLIRSSRAKQYTRCWKSADLSFVSHQDKLSSIVIKLPTSVQREDREHPHRRMSRRRMHQNFQLHRFDLLACWWERFVFQLRLVANDRKWMASLSMMTNWCFHGASWNKTFRLKRERKRVRKTNRCKRCRALCSVQTITSHWCKPKCHQAAKDVVSQRWH